jgi:hypothetical protein
VTGNGPIHCDLVVADGSDSDRYKRLNDVVCVCVGEVRSSDDPDQVRSPQLVMDVAELIWEPIAD